MKEIRIRSFVAVSMILEILLITAAATPKNSVTCIETETPTLTQTLVPTNTFTPTSTFVPTSTGTKVPTATTTATTISTATATVTRVTPSSTSTPVPTFTATSTKAPVCIPFDTGRVVNVLYMYNSSPLHYGYLDANGVYVGICRIETAAGQVPNNEFVQEYCTCDLSDFSWVTSRITVWHIMENCDGTTFLKADDAYQSSFMVNWKFGKYCPSTQCIVPR